MLKRFFSSLLIFFAMMTIMQTAQADGASFSERTANMTCIKDVRFTTGPGRLRIILDTTKSLLEDRDFRVQYLENPSRIVIDIKNTWVVEQIPKDNLEIKSLTVSKIRIAQNTPTLVRLVIESMAENFIFSRRGGPAGYQLIIDVGLDAEKTREFEKFLTNEYKSVSSGTNAPNRKIDSVDNDKDNKTDKDDKKKKKDKDKKDKSDIDKKLDDVTGLAGKIIVIDPGHGGNDSGAIGPSGVMEKTVTLRVGLVLRELLENEGAEVVMTRETDTEVAARGRHATDVEELKSRCDVANDIPADIFVSIHADSFSKPTARGTTGYYFSKGSEDSKRLADCIRKALIAQINTPSRGTQPCNFYVVRNTNMPSTLIELAFISNAEEERLLNSDEGVIKAAQGILDGIEDYFG